MRITRPRLEVLDVLHRIGGQLHHPEGRAIAQMASALDYNGSLTGLKRVIGSLSEHGLVERKARNGRVHTLSITDAGMRVLRERGLEREAPRRELIPDDACSDRGVFVLATNALAQRMNDWARDADITKPIDELRLESVLVLHDDLEPRTPDAAELAVQVARARIALSTLQDTQMTEPSSVDLTQVDDALRVVQDVRTTLIAWHKRLAARAGS